MATINRLPSALHLGCGQDYRDGWHNVDYVADVKPDEVVDLTERPWPWPAESFAVIRAAHVFEHLDDVEAVLRECRRVLKPDGRVITEWPIGLDARADPDHAREWTWRTPEFFTGARHWDRDVGLRVVDRDVRLWGHMSGVAGSALSGLCRAGQAALGDGPWCFDVPMTSGVFTVVFEVDR